MGCGWDVDGTSAEIVSETLVRSVQALRDYLCVMKFIDGDTPVFVL